MIRNNVTARQPTVNTSQGPWLRGLVAATLTPFDESGRVALDLIEPYANFLEASGVTAVFINGTTGEGASLTVEERLALAEAWRRKLPVGLRLIVHIGDNAVANVARMARHAADIEADAIAALSPWFFRPTDEHAVVGFFSEALAGIDNLPFYYYHIPSMTGVTVPGVRILAAADGRLPQLVGIKYTHNDLVDFAECIEYANGRYQMLYGRDETLLAGLALGAEAAVGSTYGVFPLIYLEIMRKVSADLEAAREAQAMARRVIAEMVRRGPIIPAAKAVLRHVGLDLGPVRRPLDALKPADAEALLNALEGMGAMRHLESVRQC